MSGVSAVQKHLLADILQNRCQVCKFIKKRLQNRCFPMKFTKSLTKPFFYRTPPLWWLLLAVNVNQRKFMLWRKKWYTWMVLLRFVFLGNEYSSEFFQTLLAVSQFSSVAWKSQQSSRGVLEKKCFWKFRKWKVYSCKFCQIFKNIFFHGMPPVAASEKLKAEPVVRRCFVKKTFFKILLNSQENTCAKVSFYSLRNATLLK